MSTGMGKQANRHSQDDGHAVIEKKFKEKYQIIERISEGNFGTVYKARDTRTSNYMLILDQIFAMKKMIASSKNKQNFIREIQNLELIQHDNV